MIQRLFPAVTTVQRKSGLPRQQGVSTPTPVMAQGTQSGRRFGRPTGIAIFRIANRKIAEQWQEADVVGLMQQLGESTAQPLTEPLGQQQTEGLQHQVNVTSPIEEAR